MGVRCVLISASRMMISEYDSVNARFFSNQPHYTPKCYTRCLPQTAAIDHRFVSFTVGTRFF